MINKSFVRVFVLFASFLVLSQTNITQAAFDRDLYFGLKNDSDVLTLQQVLKNEGCFGGAPTGNFDQATRQAVICFQIKNNFSSVPSSGYVGAYTRGFLDRLVSTSQITATTTNSSYPAGCSSNAGFSATTGQSCSASNYPSGCTSNAGFSATTGQSCSSSYYPAGCSSSAGYSATTGVKCDSTPGSGTNTTTTTTTTTNYPAGCTSYSGYSSQTGAACDGSQSSTSAQPSIKVVIPNGGPYTWRVGEQRNIVWESTGLTYVSISIEYASDNGQQSRTIANNVSASQGDYLWTIPSEFAGWHGNIFVHSADSGSTVYGVAPSNLTIAAASNTALPAGCTSTAGYSSTTGVKCDSTPGSGTTTTTSFDCDASSGYSGRVAIYQHSNYGGRCVGLSADTSSFANFDFNDITSSIRVQDGFSATLYEHINYGGRSITFTGDSSYVGSSFNDIASSIKIQLASTDTRNSIIITSPNGGEIWTAGKTYTIGWSTTYGPSLVDIYALPVNANGDLIANGIKIAENVSSPTKGSRTYSWTISSLISSGYYKIGFMVPTGADPNGVYGQYNSNIFTVSSSTTTTTTPSICDYSMTPNESVRINNKLVKLANIFAAGTYGNERDMVSLDIDSARDLRIQDGVTSTWPGFSIKADGVSAAQNRTLLHIQLTSGSSCPTTTTTTTTTTYAQSAYYSQSAYATNSSCGYETYGQSCSGSNLYTFSGLTATQCQSQATAKFQATGGTKCWILAGDGNCYLRDGVFTPRSSQTGTPTPGGSCPASASGSTTTTTTTTTTDCSGTYGALYEHSDYGGTCVPLNGDIANLVNNNFNDKLSSYKITSGYRLLLFEDANYGGGYPTVSQNSSYIGDSYNDRTSSIMVVQSTLASSDCSDTAVIRLYEHSNYEGACLAVNGGGSVDDRGVNDLGNYNFNDKVSSAKIKNAYYALVYEHSSYGGRYKTISGNVPYIGDDFNDITSSIRQYENAMGALEKPSMLANVLSAFGSVFSRIFTR